jgi:RNA polymerase sigma-70 factor (ECF subfamily)
MNCDDLLRLLADYDDGAADDCLCREVERHLAGCASCATLRQDLERVSHLCRQSARPRLPDDLRASIMALLESKGRTGDCG